MRPQLTHLGLYTPVLTPMERFYVDVIGLIVTDRGRVTRLGNADIVFMSAHPDSHHQIVLIGRPEQKGPSCVNQISFRVEGLADLRAAHSRLAQAKTGTMTPIDHGNAWSVYALDPDGNGVEIFTDTPWHVSQPHSRPLDLTLTDAEIYRRTEAAIRADPTFRPLGEWAAEMAARL